MNVKTKRKIKLIFYPFYILYRDILNKYCMRNAKKLMDKKFYSFFNRHIDWENPVDLNEKINWLKFHADMNEWAQLADKYAVREYVTGHGLSDILVPLYGKYDTVQQVLDNWDNLPDEFVLKSNNGCGHLIIVSEKNGGKSAVNKKDLVDELTLWLSEKDYGINNGEFHYQYIKNCIIAEKLLVDDSIKEFSSAPIDYKLHCCNGKPYICYVSYGRTLTSKGSHKRTGDLYDLDWNERSDLMSEKEDRRLIPRPENWERMLEIAEILSEDHPQTRIDLYNIDGAIYFGEITMTNASGFDTEFKQELLTAMGKEINLDLTMRENIFA